MPRLLSPNEASLKALCSRLQLSVATASAIASAASVTASSASAGACPPPEAQYPPATGTRLSRRSSHLRRSRRSSSGL